MDCVCLSTLMGRHKILYVVDFVLFASYLFSCFLYLVVVLTHFFIFVYCFPLFFFFQANRSDDAAASGGGEGGENPARPKNVLCPNCGMGNEVPGKKRHFQ